MAIQIKGRPFDIKGSKNVTDCFTAEEVIRKSGLNFEVEKAPIYAKADYANSSIGELAELIYVAKENNFFMPISNAYATFRTDVNYPLGLVTNSYEIVQNVDAFKFFDKAIGKDKAIWQTAGQFGNGRCIFVSAKLPNTITVNGDPVDNYLVFTNTHDGSGGVKILFTPIRVVCQNTLNAAINTATNFVSFRHTKSVHDNIDIANEILGICNTKTRIMKEGFDRLATINLNDEQAAETFASVILDNNDIARIRERDISIKRLAEGNSLLADTAEISTRKFNALYKLNYYYHMGIGQKEIEGTAWGVYNAVTGYYSNVHNMENDKRMQSLLYGTAANKIKEVGHKLLEIA